MNKADIDEVLRNYNGEELKDDETLEPVAQSDLFIATNVTQPGSVKRFYRGGKCVKGVMTAVKKGKDAEIAHKQFQNDQNYLLGHFDSQKDTVSSDEIKNNKGRKDDSEAQNPEKIITRRALRFSTGSLSSIHSILQVLSCVQREYSEVISRSR